MTDEKALRGLRWLSQWAAGELTRYKRRLKYTERIKSLDRPEDRRAMGLVRLKAAIDAVLDPDERKKGPP